MQELIKDYTERSMMSKYVTNCADDKPFYTKGGCITCGENKVFNINSEECDECDFKNYNKEAKTCVAKENIEKKGNETNTTKPAENVTALKNNTVKESSNVTELKSNETKPSANETKPAANETKPAANETKPAAN
jgi:hypothetical protein